MNKPAVQSLLNTLNSTSFREEIEGLGGYDIGEMGRLVAGLPGPCPDLWYSSGSLLT